MPLQLKPCFIFSIALSLISFTYAQEIDISCDSRTDNWPPDIVPSGFDVSDYYGSYYNMCSAKSSIHPNLGCYCSDDGFVRCPATFFDSLDCKLNCRCHDQEEQRRHEEFLQEVVQALDQIHDPVEIATMEEILNGLPEESASQATKQCTSTCTSVTRGCSIGCRCGALPVSLFFWLKASCGPMHSASTMIAGHTGLRKERRTPLSLPLAGPNTTLSKPQSTAVNSNSTMKLYDDVQELIGSGALPAPCNESYVSYACANSSDGIVHEGPEMWLGALLPANATSLPPVPKDWLLINGYPANHSSSNEWILTL